MKVLHFHRWLPLGIALGMIIRLLFNGNGEVMAQSSSSGQWSSLADGLSIRNLTCRCCDGNSVGMYCVRVIPSKWKASAVDPVGLLSEKKGAAVFSLRETAAASKAVVMINGGYTGSYSFPIPAGLLITNAKIVAKLNSVSSVQGGVFVVGPKGWDIVPRTQFKKDEYTNALQAGPLVVESPGVVGIRKSDVQTRQRYNRTIIGIDKSNRLLLIVTGPAYLYDLAKFLVLPESAGGLDCRVALNLSGDIESGLCVTQRSAITGYGSLDVPIASAIGIFGKK